MDIRGKGAARVSAERSQNPRNPRGRADAVAEALKRETTMWELLVWAYKREMVRFCAGSAGPESFLSHRTSGTARVMTALEMGGTFGGNGVCVEPGAHDDALTVHGLVLQLPRDDQWLMIDSAEAGAPPDWDPKLQAGRLVPVWRQTSHGPEPKKLYINNRPVGCVLEMDGLWPAEVDALRARARDSYTRWHENLEVLKYRIKTECNLSRWKITGIGAPTDLEIVTSAGST